MLIEFSRVLNVNPAKFFSDNSWAKGDQKKAINKVKNEISKATNKPKDTINIIELYNQIIEQHKANE